MTTNAFIFMWSELGIETVVPITQFEDQQKLDTWSVLKGEKPGPNPLNMIVSGMVLRARYNDSRCYEIYAIDCPEGTTDEGLFEIWKTSPQYMADITREKGVCIYKSSYRLQERVIK